MKSSTEDITAKIDGTEIHIARSFLESLIFSVIWTIAVPTLFGIYTFYAGFNAAAFTFMMLGLGWGHPAGAFHALHRTRKNWFRQWTPKKTPGQSS